LTCVRHYPNSQKTRDEDTTKCPFNITSLTPLMSECLICEE
jgi:hypothetical protein